MPDSQRNDSWWPYPWPEAEMVARYGMRRLTSEEQQVFPGLRPVLRAFKARITYAPAGLPRIQPGWVVWVAETYPGNYLVKLPGGMPLLAPYHPITWEPVPDETPATDLEEVMTEEKQLKVEALKWKPGQVRTTPGTRLSWNCLEGWITAWQTIHHRPHSSRRYSQEWQHLQALPPEMIAHQTAETQLYALLDILTSGDVQPPKGLRQGHPTTSLIVAANNRLAQLEAVSYRHYRQQQSLRRVLAHIGTMTIPKPQRDQPMESHLSLF